MNKHRLILKLIKLWFIFILKIKLNINILSKKLKIQKCKKKANFQKKTENIKI